MKTLTTPETLKNNDPSVAAHPSNIDPSFVPFPMDDASVARRLADHYRQHNIDPSLAFDDQDGIQQDLADMGLMERGGN